MSLSWTPLVASVQAPEGSPLDSPDAIVRMAKASLLEGVGVLRLQGIENIRAVASATSVPIIGLIKRDYDDSEVYITPTETEVDALLQTPCQVVALDGTARQRPGEDLAALIHRIHKGGRLAMADCDSLESALFAERAGADFVGTTLAGYTSSRPMSSGPDIDLLRAVVSQVRVPVIAEGRYGQRWQVEAAIAIGAHAVVVGGALNDPLKNTRALQPRLRPSRVGAVDIGGTWLRFACFEGETMGSVERIATPADPEERLAWIREQIASHQLTRVGVSTGGTVDPHTGVVWEAKPIIPGHQGSEFSERTLGVPTFALNDGLATAWAHGWHRDFAGKRVATLALGTGVGAGFVFDGQLWMGRRGEYLRLNDLPTTSGASYEDLLGGAALSPNPTAAQREKAIEALRGAVETLLATLYPDVIVLAGSVGLSHWLLPIAADLGCVPSPFGHQAGLAGASLLAWMPPI
ncbi:MAG: putative N-acetylmannosamine-6-phosphate 2-epimerase [Fimbriimonas sp.]